MKQEKQKAAMGRRDFFKTASLGAVGAAAAGLVASKGAAAETAKGDPGGKGYRETAHVKKYYELARF